MALIIPPTPLKLITSQPHAPSFPQIAKSTPKCCLRVYKPMFIVVVVPLCPRGFNCQKVRKHDPLSVVRNWTKITYIRMPFKGFATTRRGPRRLLLPPLPSRALYGETGNLRKIRCSCSICDRLDKEPLAPARPRLRRSQNAEVCRSSRLPNRKLTASSWPVRHSPLIVDVPDARSSYPSRQR
jgi:hypothetical protein